MPRALGLKRHGDHVVSPDKGAA
jgi:hypothetical protein